jgi:hypothetical protein
MTADDRTIHCSISLFEIFANSDLELGAEEPHNSFWTEV